MALELVPEESGAQREELLSLITYVRDRPGHDLRYAIDAGRLERECGCKPKQTFATGLRPTVRWYFKNRAWVESVRSGEYRQWIDRI
jgi:dTDP-glucose 4,6-dehydratase